MKRFLTSAAALAVALAVTSSTSAQGLPVRSTTVRDAQKAASASSSRPRRALPDLIISDVNVAGSTARVTVKNQGSAAAGLEALQMQVFRGFFQVSAKSLAVAPILAGGSRTVVFDLPGVNLRDPGTKLVFIADDGNQVAEADENNNFKAVVFPRPAPSPALPDLLVSSVNVTGSTARITIKNQGQAEAGLSRMSMKIFVKGKLVKTLFAAMPTIAPGQSAVVDLDARPLNLRAPGTKLVIQADDAGNVAEANEANNFKVVNSGV
ncbi:MAG TPA: CARDB domain-containing protein, partial [Gemmataceae bacterium]|nr:CARDB domain-containing protein [Gemmataceae bacterium]